MKNNHTYILAVASFLACVFSIGGYVFFHGVVTGAEDRLAEEYEALMSLRAEENVAVGAESLVRDLEDDILALQKYMVKEGDLVGFIQTVESLGRVSGADIEIASVEVGGDAEEGTELLIRFQGDGSWEDNVQLLALTEALPIRSDVTYATLRARPENVWSLSLSLQAPLFDNAPLYE